MSGYFEEAYALPRQNKIVKKSNQVQDIVNSENEFDEAEKLIISFSNQEEQYGDWCTLTVSFQITTKVKSGEGPSQIAQRLNYEYNKQLNSNGYHNQGIQLVVDWYDVVIQNPQYFLIINNQQDKTNKDYWTNTLLNPGVIVKVNIHSVIWVKCKYEFNSATELAEAKGKTFELIDDNEAKVYVKGKAYSKFTFGANFGIDKDNFNMYVDLAVNVGVNGSFLLDNDTTTPFFQNGGFQADVTLSGNLSGSLGDLTTGIDGNVKYDIIKNKWASSFSAYYSYGASDKDTLGNIGFKEDAKSELGYKIKLRKFNFDPLTNKTTISLNLKAFGKISQDIRLHPLFKFYISAEAGADVDIVIVLTGDFEPEYIENSESIDYEKTINKVNLILPENDTMYPNNNGYSLPLPELK